MAHYLYILIPPSSFGGWEFVYKVKSEKRESDNQDTCIYLDSNVHVDQDYLFTDTIQHLLYAGAQPAKAGQNGWFLPPANWGRDIRNASTFNSPS